MSTNQHQTGGMLDVAKRVAAATGKKLDWAFTMFESDQVNAFCLPGGKVGVYTGMMQVAKTKASLAAVLGHEMGHAIAHHGGHWSGLGVARGSDYSGLDSGCVWGGSSTALRLDDEQLFSCAAQERSSL